MSNSKMVAYSPRVKTSCQYKNAGMRCIAIQLENWLCKFLVINYMSADLKITAILFNNT